MEDLTTIIEQRYKLKESPKTSLKYFSDPTEDSIHINSSQKGAPSCTQMCMAPMVGRIARKPQKIKAKNKTVSPGGIWSVLRAKEKFVKKLPFLSHKLYRLGERGTGYRTSGPVQDFYKIRDYCMENNILFEDQEFPANNESLYFNNNEAHRRLKSAIKWKRPKEIVKNPKFVVDGYSRFDVVQGSLGDCWLLAPLAILTIHPRLFLQVVPDDQNFTDKYAGVFHFRIWKYGRWLDVVIDDRLPTLNGKMVYVRSSDRNEFWSALFEKAYAKVHGTYQAISSGNAIDAMEDLTGGLSETYYFSKPQTIPPNIYDILRHAYDKMSLISVATPPSSKGNEVVNEMGLYSSHAYSVTWVRPVEAHFKANEEPTKVPLLRIRNPWGYGEWLGLWSDESSVWKYVSKEEKEAIGYKFEADGEFWMDIEDLKKNFNEVGICHLSLDSLSQAEIGNREKCWKMAVFEGEWVRGVTSGGCRRHLDTFPNNPQYRIWFKTADEEDKEKKCTVIIQLMQKHRRRQFYKNLTYVFMGFQLYYLQHPDRLPKPLDKRFFQRNNYIGSSTYQNGRSVTSRFKLTPGCYCIVPTTINVTDEADFLIRVFSEHKSHLEEYDVDLNLNVSDNDEVNVLRPMVPVTYKLKQNEQEKNGNENKVENDVAEQSRKLFIQLAGDDMQIDWVQLKPILDQALKNELRGEGVSKEICRTMVAMVDKDCTGKIGYDEFKSLWINICSWKAVFNKYKDGSGSVTTSNLREALVSAGYVLNRHTLNLLVHRYGNADKNIDLDDFISCVIRLETMINSFKEIARFEKAAFTLDKWLLTTLYS